jgi:hypothetical protein
MLIYCLKFRLFQCKLKPAPQVCASVFSGYLPLRKIDKTGTSARLLGTNFVKLVLLIVLIYVILFAVDTCFL